jgi:hypothetical protein
LILFIIVSIWWPYMAVSPEILTCAINAAMTLIDRIIGLDVPSGSRCSQTIFSRGGSSVDGAVCKICSAVGETATSFQIGPNSDSGISYCEGNRSNFSGQWKTREQRARRTRAARRGSSKRETEEKAPWKSHSERKSTNGQQMERFTDEIPRAVLIDVTNLSSSLPF